ncbi:WhiB family transcriptional regulator [Streptomyces sp. NPDC058459]|uniref:WhiB family transcriptional regulator n=1 Tax=Streptomyces sp. NPDC058459 TaxID=3346508 RepID=UPI00364F461A
MGREWELQAVCRTDDPELWFTRQGHAEATRLCTEVCPVRDACLEATLRREGDLSAGYRWGIFAGLTGGERAAIAQERGQIAAAALRGPGRPLAQCGTRGAYQRHLSRGEPVDEACRAANNRASRTYATSGSSRAPATR